MIKALGASKYSQDGGMEKQNRKAIDMLVVLMFLFCVCTVAPLVFDTYIMWGPGYFQDVNIVGMEIKGL